MAIDVKSLKQSVSIIDIADQLGLKPKKTPTGAYGRCYNVTAHKHGDRNPSMWYNTAVNRYKCFACGVSGDVIDLVREVRGLDFDEAVKWIIDHGGGCETRREVDKKEPLPREEPLHPQGDFSDIYAEFIKYLGAPCKRCTEYLHARGITDETIARFDLCCVKFYDATDSWLKQQFDIKLLRSAGLLNKRDKLLFKDHRLIIPFYDSGRVVFLQGRRLDNAEPRYIHLAGIPTRIFNIDAVNEAREGSPICLCEGVFDAMILEQMGFRAVAVLGVNNFKPEWVELFKGVNVELWLDNDEAGNRASLFIANLFRAYGQYVVRRLLPEGIKDITEYVLMLKGEK